MNTKLDFFFGESIDQYTKQLIQDNIDLIYKELHDAINVVIKYTIGDTSFDEFELKYVVSKEINTINHTLEQRNNMNYSFTIMNVVGYISEYINKPYDDIFRGLSKTDQGIIVLMLILYEYGSDSFFTAVNEIVKARKSNQGYCPRTYSLLSGIHYVTDTIALNKFSTYHITEQSCAVGILSGIYNRNTFPQHFLNSYSEIVKIIGYMVTNRMYNQATALLLCINIKAQPREISLPISTRQIIDNGNGICIINEGEYIIIELKRTNSGNTYVVYITSQITNVDNISYVTHTLSDIMIGGQKDKKKFNGKGILMLLLSLLISTLIIVLVALYLTYASDKEVDEQSIITSHLSPSQDNVELTM